MSALRGMDPGVWATLGRALRREAAAGGGALCRAGAGDPSPRGDVAAALGPTAFALLERDGTLCEGPDGSSVVLRDRLLATPDFVVASPDTDPTRPDLVYLGPDSRFLAEAALRLAPAGDRACDLGTGTGLLAAVLSRRYRLVVASDIALRSVWAARRTLLLNERPAGHSWAVVRADVTSGLRRGAFDLVTANAPWVPSAARPGEAAHVFADGGRDGVELPLRFLHGAADLLRPGGTAILLALEVTRDDGGRPLSAACTALGRAGFTVSIIPTPINDAYGELPARMRNKAPHLRDVVHVAVVAGAPGRNGSCRAPLRVACEALARRWGTNVLTPDEAQAA